MYWCMYLKSFSHAFYVSIWLYEWFFSPSRLGKDGAHKFSLLSGNSNFCFKWTLRKILTFLNSMINERHISLNTMHLFRIFLWSTLCLWYMYLFYFLTLVHALDIFIYIRFDLISILFAVTYIPVISYMEIWPVIQYSFNIMVSSKSGQVSLHIGMLICKSNFLQMVYYIVPNKHMTHVNAKIHVFL